MLALPWVSLLLPIMVWMLCFLKTSGTWVSDTEGNRVRSNNLNFKYYVLPVDETLKDTGVKIEEHDYLRLSNDVPGDFVFFSTPDNANGDLPVSVPTHIRFLASGPGQLAKYWNVPSNESYPYVMAIKSSVQDKTTFTIHPDDSYGTDVYKISYNQGNVNDTIGVTKKDGIWYLVVGVNELKVQFRRY